MITHLGRYHRTAAHHRQTINRAAAALAVAMMVCCAILFADSDSSRLELAVAALVAGVLLQITALYLDRRPLPGLPMPRGGALLAAERSFARRALLTVSGAGLLWVVAETNGDWIGLKERFGLTSGAQFGLLCAGITLVALGLGDVGWPRQRLTWPVTRPVPWRGVLIVAGIMALALLVRVWALNTLVHVFVDELNFATTLQGFWRQDDVGLLVPMTGVVAFPKLFVYWQAQTVALMGRNLAGLRLASAILGTLTIPALYLLARTLYDRPTALIAAALLAVFPPHIHFSRLGLNNIADPLFGTLALAFAARGLRSNRRLDFALAGVFLGLTQYFYEGGRIIYPLLMLAWLAAGRLTWRQRPPWRGLVILLLAAVLVCMPVYYTLLAIDAPLTARSESMSLPRAYWSALLRSSPGDEQFNDYAGRVRDTFLITVHQPELSSFYGGQTPLLLVYMVPALLLGIGVMLARLRTPGALLLVGWILAVSLGNSTLVANLDAARYVVVFPALILVCALGIRWLLHVIEPARLHTAGIVLLVIGLAAGQIVYYFGPHIDRYNTVIRAGKHYPDGEDAIFRSVNFPPGTQIHLISTTVFPQSYASDAIHFLADDLEVETLSPDEITMAYVWNLRRDVDHAFFIEAGLTGPLELLEDSFQLQPPVYSPHDIPPGEEYVLYYAPSLLRD
ncbi:MAG: glycosyltransferase family 39 protein [Anaerolineae bacterium]|nr:glycosyltransferase family 39 protein [Anaerolineae bacterium]